jgi:hypothetical protein
MKPNAIALHGSRSSDIMVFLYDKSGNIHAQELIETKR